MTNHPILIDIGQILEKRATAVSSMLAGISYAEYKLLAALDQTEAKSLTRVQLSEAVGLTPSGVSRALKPLEKIGLVASVKAPRDARQSLAQLTEAGQEVCINVGRALTDHWQGLPASGLEYEAVESYLAALTSKRTVPARS